MMASPRFNQKSPTIRRILREAQELSTTPSLDYTATPLESDLFEWHFTLRGPPNSAYAEGLYHGRIVLPRSYPLRPPSFRFTTPSGRFEANREICLSISGHHEETWQPAWGIRTALVALRSFMETDPKGQLGGLDASDAVRRRMAGESRGWRCPGCKRSNEEIIRECEEKAKEVEEKEGIQGTREEVEVPKDLKMGWRDEMEASAEAASAKAEGQALQRADDDSESAELAEGFVQTIPMQAAPALDASIPIPVRPSPAQTVPQPTGATGAPQAAALAAPALPVAPQVLQQHRQDDGVPVWIDRLIVVIGVVLVAMVLRIIFAL